ARRRARRRGEGAGRLTTAPTNSDTLLRLMARRQRGGARGERRRGRRGAARHQPPTGPARGRGQPRSPPQAPKAERPRPPRRTCPTVTPGPAGPPRPGEWLYATRPGAEIDLIEEIAFADPRATPRPVAPALVASRERPEVELAFARQALPVASVVEAAPG